MATYVESDGGLNLGGNSSAPYVMPVMPAYGGYGGGFGNSFGFGNDSIWAIVLFAMIFGGNGWGGFGGGNNNMLYDINANTNRGFDQAAVVGGLTAIQGALSDAQVARCNDTTTLLQAMNSNQNVTNATLADLAMAQQNCCCDNRLAVQDLKYTVATENCADRAALNDGIRDIIANQTAGIQSILDKLCSQEIEAKNETIANLRTQLNMANLAASQTAQTAAILNDNARQTTTLENYLNPAPIPAYVVSNPHGCNCNTYGNGFGFGFGNGFWGGFPVIQ